MQEMQEKVDRRKAKSTLPKPQNYLLNLRAATSTGPKRPTRRTIQDEDSEDSSLLLSTQPLVARRMESNNGKRGKSQPRTSGHKGGSEEDRASTGFEMLGEVSS